jgi:hypothetical protein
MAYHPTKRHHGKVLRVLLSTRSPANEDCTKFKVSMTMIVTTRAIRIMSATYEHVGMEKSERISKPAAGIKALNFKFSFLTGADFTGLLIYRSSTQRQRSACEC